MTARDLDCLFVHAPKAHNHYLPLGDFINICYMPMGLPALANWLHQHGHHTEIVHLGVEWVHDPSYHVVRDFDGAHLRAIGLPLYWHYQSYDAVEVARALGRAHPEAFVFLGGVTAAYFGTQILESFPEIHAIVPGHGEGPVLALMETLKAGGDLGQVPNLLWRDAEGVIHDNRLHHKYFGRAPELDALSFGDLSRLRHADVYARSFGFPLAWSREYTADENRRRLNMGRPFFPLFTGRGCPWSCTFCGGNRDTLKRVNGGGGVAWRSADRVLDDIRRAMDHGYRTVSLCFDPTPTRDDYYVDLFDRIHASKLGVDMYFECWGLPTPRFVRHFRRAFPSPESYLAISPDAGDEEVRRLNKQPWYSDAELLAACGLLQEAEISADVFYTIALPGETVKEGLKTRDQMRLLSDRFPNLRRIMVWSVQLEPGSPQFERPGDFDMVTDRHTFLDFYRLHGGLAGDTYSSLGFKINHYFGDSRDDGGIPDFERHLQHLKCMELCFLSPDPREHAQPEAGRNHCFQRRKELAIRRGTTLPTRAIGPDHDYNDALREEREARGPQERMSWL